MFLTFVAVPEAAVNEDRYLLLKEDKVGVTFDIVVAAPACNAVFLEDLDEFQLRGFVVLGTDVAHYLAAFFCGENVGHWLVKLVVLVGKIYSLLSVIC